MNALKRVTMFQLVSNDKPSGGAQGFNTEEAIVKLQTESISLDEKRIVFDSLMTEWQKQLMKWSRKLTFSFEDAEDVRNETMLRIFNKIHTYDAAKGSFGAWSYSLLRNIAFDFNSKKYRYQNREGELLKENTEEEMKNTEFTSRDILALDLQAEIEELLEQHEIVIYKGKVLKKNEKEIFDDLVEMGFETETPRNINYYVQNIFKRIKRKIVRFIDTNPKYALSDDFVRSKVDVYNQLKKGEELGAFQSLIIWEKRKFKSDRQKFDLLIAIFCRLYGFDEEKKAFDVNAMKKLSEICSDLNIDRNELESLRTVFSEEIIKSL